MRQCYGNGTIKVRDSNLELFRIIVMLMIIAHHYVVNSGLLDVTYKNSLSFNSIFLLLFGAWGKTGINCFVLITGYFMCQSNITAKKYLRLFFEVEFYRIILYMVFWLSGYEPFSIMGLLKAVIPFSSVADGFTSCYLLFFLFIPFLNILIRHMNEKMHFRLVVLSLFVYTGLGTIPKITVFMNYISWFIVLYILAAYIRCYPKKIFSKARVWGLISIGAIVVSSVSTIVCFILGSKLEKELAYYFLADSNKILAVFTAISTFLFFKNINIKYNRCINMFGGSTFGIFLIHAHSDAMRRWLWWDVLGSVKMFSSNWLMLHAVVSIVVIFIVAGIIDQFRIQFIERPFFKIWDRQGYKVIDWLNKVEKQVCIKLDIKEE